MITIQVPERDAVEDLWRGRLRDAQAQLVMERARADALLRAVTEGRLLDGAYVLQEALRREMMAQCQYGRALSIFSDLIMDGKIPDEDEWCRLARFG